MPKKRSPERALPGPALPASKLQFSFEFYDTDRPEYCLSSWSQEQIRGTLVRLKDLSTKTLKEIVAQRKTYHFYETIWERTIEPQGFSDPRIKELDPFHFALLGVNGQKARVYGALANDTFYVVWFDLEHAIWPTFKKHT